MYNYIVNNNLDLSTGGETAIQHSQLLSAIKLCNKALKEIDSAVSSYDISIFDSLGLRNLSGFVGEVFVKCIEKSVGGNLTKNPHQDGYPDLLLTNTPQKFEYLNSLLTFANNKSYPINKDSFSPFSFGGYEVKATCGNTPQAKIVPKPLIGESRIELLQSFEWKAHHRDTRNLIGILWDFIDSFPVISACFYCNSITENDWGKVIVPAEGSKTTSVSIMSKSGVQKMCTSWFAVIDDERYISKLSNTKWIGYDVRDNL